MKGYKKCPSCKKRLEEKFVFCHECKNIVAFGTDKPFCKYGIENVVGCWFSVCCNIEIIRKVKENKEEEMPNIEGFKDEQNKFIKESVRIARFMESLKNVVNKHLPDLLDYYESETDFELSAIPEIPQREYIKQGIKEVEEFIELYNKLKLGEKK